MFTNQHPFRISRASVSLVVTSLSLLLLAGCSTAASMGLPVSTSANHLMHAADKSREENRSRSSMPTELAKQVQQPHRLEVGDVLAVETNDFNSTIRLPGDQTVLPDGTIELGSFGTLMVAGKSVKEVERDVQEIITAKVAARKPTKGDKEILQASGVSDSGYGEANRYALPVDNSTTVRLVRQESALFYVLGEVNAPGAYPLLGNETVLDAILAAGGVSALANDHKIILTRPSENGEPLILPVCYQSIVQLGKANGNFQLRPGDRIYVPSLSLMEDLRQSLTIKKSRGCPYCGDGR